MDPNARGRFSVYDPLPESIECPKQLVETDQNIEDSVMSLNIVEKSLQKIDKHKITSFRYINIDKTKSCKKNVPVPTRNRKTCLSLHERRKLGLYHIKRTGMKFNEILPLHDLWKQYFSDALNLKTLESQGFSCLPTDRAWDQVSMSLYRADYHGAFLQVIRSKCASLVGKKGIVLMDTKNTFKIISEDNIVRTVPKIHSVFSLVLGKYKFTIFGKSFCTRPAERTVKKLKSHTLADL